MEVHGSHHLEGMDPSGGRPVAAARAQVPAARALWSDGLHGKIVVGDGRERQAAYAGPPNHALQFLAKVPQYAAVGLFKLATAVPRLVLAGINRLGGKRTITERIARFSREREAALDRKFESDNSDLLRDLTRGFDPDEQSCVSEQAVSLISEHAAKKGIEPKELKKLVRAGERIMNALAAGDGRLPLQVNKKAVHSGVYTTRAVAWFLYARAAGQDVLRAQAAPGSAQSDIATEGSFRMSDPQGRLFKFLASAPTAASRLSSHFNAQTDAPTRKVFFGWMETRQHLLFGFIPTGLPSQQGIEDHRRRLPGPGGTMLFASLQSSFEGGGQELFMKFEDAGMPAYFGSEKHLGSGDRLRRMFAVAGRNIQHVFNFKTTRDVRVAEAAGEVNRHEHTFKGILRAPVAEKFLQLVDAGIQAGVIRADAKYAVSSMKKFGLPFVKDATQHLQNLLPGNAFPEFRESCADLLKTIAAKEDELNAGYIGPAMDRRGAEVHVNFFQPPRLPLAPEA